ncbi:hypothetical protein [Salinimonas lutimaris]|uniref:hypothetical protein n=1 Tax=Salinimonas lutimaris TaxID=914153 RepID=UPI0010C00CCC|nr:hypothetical protein [Salinimonas lutimaris]
MKIVNQNAVPITHDEANAISGQAFNNIRHVAQTLQAYVLENDLELKPENEAVISALLNRIISECE